MKAVLSRVISRWLPLWGFRGSQAYWRKRYQLGGDSGSGSAGVVAAYKAEVLNRFVESHGITDVIEFGCGDGRQLKLAVYPRYIGVDISRDAVDLCRSRFSYDQSKSFMMLEGYRGGRAELALSLDVLFHLVEDRIYHEYLDRLFAAAGRYVAIYSTDTRSVQSGLRHVRHRPVSKDILENYPNFSRLAEYEGQLARAPGEASFMLYERCS